MEPANLWRCLVAYGADSAIASEICALGTQTLTSALAAIERRQPAVTVSQPPILIDLTNPTEDLQFQELVRMLAALPASSRRAVLANLVGGVPIEDLVDEADADELDLIDGIRRLEHAEPGRSLQELLTPVFDLPVPDLEATNAQTGSNWLAVVALVAAGFVSVILLTSTTSDQTAHPGLESAATTSSTAFRSTAANQFVEPDRDVRISITDADTLVRREPGTSRVMWESSPFADLEILSIDPNTLTIMTRGYRLIVSLTDGTLLPP